MTDHRTPRQCLEAVLANLEMAAEVATSRAHRSCFEQAIALIKVECASILEAK